MMSLLNSKKAVFQDAFTIVISLVTFALVMMFGYLFLSEFMTSTPITDMLAVSGNADIINVPNQFMNAWLMFDYIFVLIMVVLIIVLMIISAKVPTSRVFFIITFIMAPFVGFFSYVFSYIFSTIVSDASLAGIFPYFPKTILICTNLHWVALVSMLIGSIAMYHKRDSEQIGEIA